MIIDDNTANRIYDVLEIECGAPPQMRLDFICFCARSYSSREYRFIGHLGFGGKFWHNNNKFYVSCYREDETDERVRAIEKANKALAEIYERMMA